MSLLDYASSDARTHWRDVLDAAQDDRAVLVRRDNDQAAVINARRLRRFLAQAVPANAVVAAENGGFSIYLEDQPVAADGPTLDAALAEMVDALRSYAEAWNEVLGRAPNHRDNWGLVRLIEYSTDDELSAWLTGRL